MSVFQSKSSLASHIPLVSPTFVATALFCGFSIVAGGCTGDASDGSPEPSPSDAGPNEPEAILGWEAVEMDAVNRRRWGFVSVDLGDNKAFVFGGSNIDDFGGEVLGDAFIIDSSADAATITDVAVDNSVIAPRYCGCAAYDAGRNEVILVGGRSLQDFYTDTFIFDVDTRSFTLINAPGPTAVIGCALTFVDDGDTAYLFGGGSLAGDLLDEMWKWDPDARSWAQVEYAAGQSPIGRYDGIMREIPAGGPLYLFGGFGGGDYLSDLWTFDLDTLAWAQVSATGPAARRVPWMVAEPSGDGFYVGFGSYDFQEGEVHADLWRFDVANETWQEETLAEGPNGRGFSQWLPGGPGTIGLVLGGYDGVGPLDEAWQLRAPESGGF